MCIKDNITIDNASDGKSESNKTAKLVLFIFNFKHRKRENIKKQKQANQTKIQFYINIIHKETPFKLATLNKIRRNDIRINFNFKASILVFFSPIIIIKIRNRQKIFSSKFIKFININFQILRSFI